MEDIIRKGDAIVVLKTTSCGVLTYHFAAQVSRREISNGQNEKHNTRNRLVHKSYFLNFIYIAVFCRLSSKLGAFPVPSVSGS